MVDLKARPLGATATLGTSGYPIVGSESGGQIKLVAGASQIGFDPIDLLLASLSACISMSVRIAARHLGQADRFEGVTVDAKAEKATDGSHRVNRFIVTIGLKGRFTTAERHAIADHAERICTVSNALSPRPEILLLPMGDMDKAFSPSAIP